MKASNYLWYALVFTIDTTTLTKYYKTYKGLLRHICRTYKGKQYYAHIYIKPINESESATLNGTP